MDSTQNKLQISENAKVSGELFAVTTTRLIPMTVNGAADSMSTATTLVYILDISGESAPSVRARACRRRKHIIEVTITFKLTVSEIHATARRTGLPPFSTDLLGKAVSTIVKIASTEKIEKKRKARSEILESPPNERHIMIDAPEEARNVNSGRAMMYQREFQIIKHRYTYPHCISLAFELHLKGRLDAPVAHLREYWS